MIACSSMCLGSGRFNQPIDIEELTTGAPDKSGGGSETWSSKYSGLFAAIKAATGDEYAEASQTRGVQKWTVETWRPGPIDVRDRIKWTTVDGVVYLDIKSEDSAFGGVTVKIVATQKV